ncbi:MAG: helix-turn-helix domain-containing protein [Defluviitaleaceae bacterium]|nr:helix-turn-helix domain-containing protein [Defluviitaleaceae bacterium]MCL2274707.1 helix-turn-helix domain-containing protein [Defluviitaleaceae bacterium]
MVKIGNMDVGTFIKKARKQRGLTQSELADGIIGRRDSLSKIETGKISCSYDTLVQLIERLGYSADILPTDEWQRKNEVEASLSARNTVTATQLVAELEANDDFMYKTINRQYILRSKAAIAIINEESPAKIIKMVDRALKMSIPNFDEKRIEEYLLTSNDIILINQLSLVRWESSKRDDAVNTMLALMRNFENNCADPRYLGRHYPTLVFNLTSYLRDMNRQTEAIPLCDKGIDICIKTYDTYMLPQITSNKACCLFDIGDRDGSLSLFKQVYYSFEMYKMYRYKEIIRNFVADNFNIVL